MSESFGFLAYYHQTLKEWVTDADIPPEIKEQYLFDCLVKQQAGREVYFVTRVLDNKKAVLRVTAAGDAKSATAEKAILDKLDHPAIPKLMGAFEYKDRGYLLREYFSGDDLFTYVAKHGPLSFDQLTDIALKLCDLLSYLHGQQPPVIHRDIKPENIILTDSQDIKLIDFDIARTFRPDATTDTQVIGTKPYMAPEQFGSEQSDNRADLYALGMVMVFLATGKPNKSVLEGKYPYKALVPIIRTCTRKDRDQRFRTAAQLKRRILWARRGMTKRLLLSVAAGLTLAAVFLGGMSLGHKRGFMAGVDSILSTSTEPNKPFTPQQLHEVITFDDKYMELAVRNILGNKEGTPIYREQMLSAITDLKVFGTYIVHPSLDEDLQKTHLEKGGVSYMTKNGMRINVRGDIASLKDVPNMYYLRDLALTNQHIADLAPLAGMKLTNLNITDNFVGNLLPLKDMVSLTQLDVSQNPLNDLWPISRLLSLIKLDISQTDVSDLSALKNLNKLEVLMMSYTDVKDISVLSSLPNLRVVDLSHTKVSDLRPLLREDRPITVYAAGLDDKALSAVCDLPGIVIRTSPQGETP